MSSPDPILALGEGVISGIAAGEVVERPASVVKELVENSLDAGARRIVVEYEDRQEHHRIVVSDDGRGVPADQLKLAVARHATSKIRSLEDLHAVRSFGFRGEALASIAAVARLELISRTHHEESGSAVCVAHGAAPELASVAARRGTTVTVSDLFANVPARRKFLKSAGAEYGVTADTVRRIALAEQGVHLRLLHNRKEVFDAAPVSSLDLRIEQLYGRELAALMVPLEGRHGALAVRGAVSLAGSSQGSSRRMSIFVNGRWVHDRALFRAVMEAYRSYLLKGRYPAVVIFLEVDPAVVDVNVHPAKREVRFSDGAAVERFLIEAIREALRQRTGPLGRWGLSEHQLRAASRPQAEAASPLRERASAISPVDAGAADEPAPTAPIDGYRPSRARRTPAEAGGEAGRIAEAGGELWSGRESPDDTVRVLGQAFDGYIVCQRGDALVLVDQHALHERLLFERLLKRSRSGQVPSQRLLVSVPANVGGEGVALVTRCETELSRAGWQLEPFGEEAVVVRAMPSMLRDRDARALAERLVSDMLATGEDAAGAGLDETILATVACHAAVRVGKRLDLRSAQALLEEAASVEFSAACPHGRPVARSLSRVQVERLFGR